MWRSILILLGLLVLSAFFSGMETAFVSLSQLKVRALKEQKRKGADTLIKLKHKPKRVLITILIGNNLVNIGASAYSAVVLTRSFGDVGIGIATGGMTLLILTFGEILPKTYFANHAEKFCLNYSNILAIMQFILFPFVFVFEKMSDFISPEKKKGVTETEIKTMIEMGAEDLILHEKQEELMQSVFDFDDTVAREIMTPRVDIFGFDENEKIKDIKKEIGKMGYSRIPVYKHDIDNIIGYFHIRDLLNANENHTIKTICNKVLHVSSEKIIQELFIEMQRQRAHIAVVVDEFGGTAGIITMEDIMEELVGEIFDESDDEEDIRKVGRKRWLVNGDCDIEMVNEKTSLKLNTHLSYNSIGGYVQHKLNDLPHEGQKISLKSCTIEVIKMSNKKVEKIMIKVK